MMAMHIHNQMTMATMMMLIGRFCPIVTIVTMMAMRPTMSESGASRNDTGYRHLAIYWSMMMMMMMRTMRAMTMRGYNQSC